MNKMSFTPQEVAEATGKSTVTVYRHLRSGKLPAAKPGGEYVITRSDLATYLGSEERVAELFPAAAETDHRAAA